ncbi:MAG: glycosyltransferase [Planctomycetes bacterium]|nr:glycosyltransferase [Planctomycetota bacterium]
MPSAKIDLTILIPAMNEAENLRALLPGLHGVAKRCTPHYEIIVVDGGSTDGTPRVAESLGAEVVTQSRRGYGGALHAGFAAASGEYILTMDADLSHPPTFVKTLWRHRGEADLVIASRYVPGGGAEMPRLRWALSRILNVIFSRGMALNLYDVSSGFRLYSRRALAAIRITRTDFDVLEEILIQVHRAGRRIIEAPFHYAARRSGRSHAKLVRFGLAYLRLLVEMGIAHRKCSK